VLSYKPVCVCCVCVIVVPLLCALLAGILSQLRFPVSSGMYVGMSEKETTRKASFYQLRKSTTVEQRAHSQLYLISRNY
jgi:hypothetical protein